MTEVAALLVRDVLAMHEMRDAELVAGGAGLDRKVTGVNIVEVPDVSRWLRGGELLFTAGYAWRGDQTQLLDALYDFHRLKVSALVWKLGTYVDKIPSGARLVADDLGLPIIRLPESVAYMDVIDPLNDQLRARRLWTFERLRDTEEELIIPGLDDQSIERVAGVLARQINNPVYVVDLIDEVVVSATSDGSSSIGSLDSLPGDVAERVTSVLPTVRQNAGRTPVRQTVGDGRGELHVALVVSREVRGLILATENGARLDDFAHLTLSHAAQLISFLLLKRLAHLEGRAEAMTLLVRSLLEDEMTNEEAVERALALGLRLTRPCAALVVGPSDTGIPEQLETFRRSLSRAIGQVPHVIGSDGETTTILVQADQESSFEALQKVADRALQVARQQNLRRPIVGVGSVLVGLHGLRRSRSEAMIAYQTRSHMGLGGLVDFNDLGVERLLSQIPSTEVTKQFVRATIGAIEHDPELIRTLEAYVESGGRKVVAARKLPLHRSSLEYRLEKISRLLEVDLTSSERQLELWLALRLNQVHTASVLRGYKKTVGS